MPNPLIIDLDGVLRAWDPAVIGGAEANNGLPSGALLRAAFADQQRLQAAITGLITDRQWRAAIADELAAQHGPAGHRAVRDWSRSAGAVNAEVLALVREQRLVRPVALLSNATDRLPDDLARLGLDRELDAVFGSWQLGLAKPDQAVFIEVSERLGVMPGDCLLVDDSAGHVQAAVEAGMRGHHFTSAGELATFLAEPPLRRGR